MSSSWTCQLSGQPLDTSKEEVVVTPSGKICLKRLLLSKLADNGAIDPFLEGSVPLAEDALVTLSTSAVIPPRPQVTSMPSLLGLLQSEYDALVLELFDTRKTLEETRKELSHALYQNDAAVRVVARLAMERDAARQELKQWQASGGAVTAESKPSPAEAEEEAEPPAKRAKTDTSAIPQEDLQVMVETWQTLSQERKQRKKQAQPSLDLANFEEVDKKSWHKTRNKAGIVDIAISGNQVVTGGRDKQLVVYSMESKQLVHTIGTDGVVVSSVDMLGDFIVAGRPDGMVVLYKDGGSVAQVNVETPIVHVALHPTKQHVVVTTESAVHVYRITSGELEKVTEFASPDDQTYTAGGLHPDGLIYAAGTSEGKVHLWDFKSQQLASTLESEEVQGSMVQIAFSNNGYHLAICTSDKIQVRDLKKGKVLATLDGGAVAFDESGKHLGYSNTDGDVTVVAVKDSSTPLVTLPKGKHAFTKLVWTSSQLVACGDADRQVHFFGIKDDAMEE